MNYNIFCSSYFDPLGHPLFAKKIVENIRHLNDSNSIVRVFAVSQGFSDEGKDEVFLPISVPFFGRLYSIENKKILVGKYGYLGKVIHYIVRFFTITIFYLKVYKNISNKEVNIDLEFEPIQDFFASILRPFYGNHVGVIHNFPLSGSKAKNPIYKKISLKLFKYGLNKYPNRKLAVMNESALSHAIEIGLCEKRMVLAGWGYDLMPFEQKSSQEKTSKLTRLLSFGVMRRDKRISELTELFIALDNKDIQLNIIGKSIDIDVKALRKKVTLSRTNTDINIQDIFVEDDKVADLIKQNDIMVLSHQESFTSMSGPMLLALQYSKPILCFSSNAVADLVIESGSGIVLNMNEHNLDDLVMKINDLKNLEYDSGKLEKFQWKSITKRLITSRL